MPIGESFGFFNLATMKTSHAFLVLAAVCVSQEDTVVPCDSRVIECLARFARVRL